MRTAIATTILNFGATGARLSTTRARTVVDESELTRPHSPHEESVGGKVSGTIAGAARSRAGTVVLTFVTRAPLSTADTKVMGERSAD